MNGFQNYWLLNSYRQDIYNEFICCLLCNSDDADWKNPFFGSDILNAVYGREGASRLTCSGTRHSDDTDFCSTGADFSIQNARNLAQCPGYSAHSGVNTPTRYVEYPSPEDDVICGNAKCSGHGICNKDRTECICDAYSWGANCEFSKSPHC
jgi:hypothetical protein